MIHTVDAVISGFNTLLPIAQIHPRFEGESVAVTVELDYSGELDIDNNLYSIDSNGYVYVINPPVEPINHFIRYRVQTAHDECQFVEDIIQVRWSAIDLKPEVIKIIGEIYALNQTIAFIANIGIMPPTASYSIFATNENTVGAFEAASVFDITTGGIIYVEDYYLLKENTNYHFIVRVLDESNQSIFETEICLGPFTKGVSLLTSTMSASEACSPIITTTSLPLDCSALAPYYPVFLNPEELEYFEMYCLEPVIPVPIFSIMYEPCVSDILEERSYLITMEGLDSEINSPQIFTMEEGQTNKTVTLVGAVTSIVAVRSKESLVFTFHIGAETAVSANIHDRDLDVDPLDSTISYNILGHINPLIITIESRQLHGKSDDHGKYIRQNGICYGRVKSILGVNPDSYYEPDGGEFSTKAECEF